MKIILILIFIATMSLTSFSQNVQDTTIKNTQSISFAYISIEGRVFSKKLKVEVDFGDTPEQLTAGKEFSEKLSNKRSYAAVLNYMVDNQFELVETLDYNYIYTGSGGTAGIVFIMRKKK